MTVLGLWRYPLKSARAEPLAQAELSPSGVQGDRAWVCVDLQDDTVGSLKHPGRWGGLLDVTAHEVDGQLVTQVPGQLAGTGSDQALSAHLGRPVRVRRGLPEDARLHRLLPEQPGMASDWATLGRPGEEVVTPLVERAWAGSAVDFGAVHLVTTGALARLGRPDVGPLRWRPNLLLDLPDDPPVGARLQLGDTVLEVQLPTPRCVVPAVTPDGLDRALLAHLAAHERRQVGDLGRAPCVGAYAHGRGAGTVRAGDGVRVLS